MCRSKQVVILFVAAALLAGCQTAAWAATGYSVRSNADGHLYRIDMPTGAATDLGAVGLTDAEGLAFAGKSLYAIGGTTGSFWNITTPPGILVGNTGPRTGVDAGLDYDRISGKMYNIQGDSSGHSLYEINISTGAATLIGASNLNTFGDGLAIDAGGQAFAADWIFTDSLYRVNLATGVFTLVGSLGIGDVSAQSGLSFDETGTLWALTDGGQIFKLNTGTGAATFVSNVTLNGNQIASFEGLAIVPEPLTMLMMCFALGGMGIRRGTRRCR